MTEVDEELRTRAEARVGTVLRGKYTVERVIGIGGMASVYAASHRNGRQVGLKLLHPELSVRADLRTRFLREAQAANAVKHSGVVVILDDDVAEDGAAFLVMELLEGQNVEELWEAHSRRLPAKMVLTIASELCAVLAAAHEAGVVHRDLKPANLFVTREGELKVLDFGIARLRAEAGPHATQTGTVFGTPAFMAPEQAGGLVSELGPLTDIWAVGATMFTLLSGRPVHDGQSGQHIIILAATLPAPSLASVMPEAPPEIVAIVDRALALDKLERWASAAEMRTALDEALTRASEQEADDATLVRGTLSETMLAIAGVKAIGDRSGTLQSAGNNAPFLGGTTGQPVSSSAITEVDPAQRRTSAWKRARDTVRGWLRLRRGGGADSVASDAPTRRRFSGRLAVPAIVAALVTVALSALAAVGVQAFLNRPDTRAIAPPTPIQSPEEEHAPDVHAVPQPPTTDEPVLPATSLASAPEPPRTAVSASTRAPKAPPRPRHQAAPAVPAPDRNNCNPAFTIQEGIQVHKPWCP